MAGGTLLKATRLKSWWVAIYERMHVLRIYMYKLLDMHIQTQYTNVHTLTRAARSTSGWVALFEHMRVCYMCVYTHYYICIYKRNIQIWNLFVRATRSTSWCVAIYKRMHVRYVYKIYKIFHLYIQMHHTNTRKENKGNAFEIMVCGHLWAYAWVLCVYTIQNITYIYTKNYTHMHKCKVRINTLEGVDEQIRHTHT